MTTISLKSIDVGFDPSLQDSVGLRLDVDKVLTDSGDFSGSPMEIAKGLSTIGINVLCYEQLVIPSVNGYPHVQYDIFWSPDSDSFKVSRSSGFDGSELLSREELFQAISNHNGLVGPWLLQFIDPYAADGPKLRNEICVEHTANGREIRYDRKKDRFVVQPENDNYWIEKKTLSEAKKQY